MTPNGQSDPSLDKAAIREPLPADAGSGLDVGKNESFN